MSSDVNECSLTTFLPTSVLGPKGLRLIKVTDVSLLVEWESVRGAEYYILSYYPKGDEGAIKEVQVESTKNSYLITGLRPGVTYIVQVYAVIRSINSESDEIVATTGKNNCLNTTNIFVIYMESFVKSIHL